MSRPLFVLQAPCKDRLSCKECRDPKTSVYREGWSQRYQMPPGWPECPFGYPMGFQGVPAPVAVESLSVLIDEPESEAARRVREKVEARAEQVRPTCLECPGKNFRGISEDGLTVDCMVGYKCCGGGLSRGDVYLGCGACNKGYWQRAAVQLNVVTAI